MISLLFLKGIVIGLAIAAPVGPIGALCVQRTLAEGRISGLVSGLGAATADTIYGFIAAFGMTLISGFLISHQMWLRIIGGAILFALGLKTFLSRPRKQAAPVSGNSLVTNFFSTFGLTLTNPITILSFAAIFAALGVVSGSLDLAALWTLVLGVFFGSALWWLILSGGASLFRGWIGTHGMRWVNRISGVIIVAFGALVLASVAGPWADVLP
ncbi:MAG: LysE/ArgO family amino acid transporter [Alphaproteobacteria bacterium]